MPTRENPVTAHFHGDGVVVQLQGGYRGPARGGLPFNPKAVGTPGEVLEPGLEPGVEQRHRRSRFWINRGGLVPLVTVAQGTAQPQVELVIGAPLGSRDDVLDLKGR